MLSFLENPGFKLIFFGGKGGVGKTTCAAAAALYYARRSPQGSFLLVSTDPAHSLADSLGDFPPPPSLQILEFNAQDSLKVFKTKHHGKLAEIAARGTFLDQEDISRFLHLSLPGLDELMALLEIAGWAESGAYDRIVVDTAPTGHTLRLLATPELLRNWLKALDALLAKHRFMKQRFRGSYLPDEVDKFLVDLDAAVQRMEALLRNPRACRFVPVMLAEEMVISETVKLLGELHRLHIPVTEVLVNRLYPENPCPVCAEGRRRQRQLLGELFSRGSFSGYSPWGAPLAPEEVRGPLLETFWDGVTALDSTPPIIPESPLELPPRVEGAPLIPSPDLAFLIFAGKGGVGKTTLACATAVRLAQELPGREILLFSTDPAHSLAACLEVDIGPRPLRLAPGLTALEIDAQGEFAALKRQYQQELEKFLKTAFENFDLPFDRQVLERMLDLSPPGLDEIMALLRTMEFLEPGRYDTLILDSAPTGHLLRLLELPELIDDWLKTFFGLLLKYKLSLRFPNLSKKLVGISRDLKVLRNLWQDPSRTALYGVTILTEMAFQETGDLLAACGRLRIPAPVLLLNQATPAGDCPLCAALHRREGLIRHSFSGSAPPAACSASPNWDRSFTVPGWWSITLRQLLIYPPCRDSLPSASRRRPPTACPSQLYRKTKSPKIQYRSLKHRKVISRVILRKPKATEESCNNNWFTSRRMTRRRQKCRVALPTNSLKSLK
ncbi:MAG: ArsA family ATPase [Deltaproteobacteria bacterium]|nr:ArsA family ATPase [Deltaproteobacteria bacterium]